MPEYDYAVTAEAKGIPLVHEMARLDGNRRYVLARKAPKLYMTGVFGVRSSRLQRRSRSTSIWT